MCTKPFSQTKNKGKLFLVAKSSGPLLARMPLNYCAMLLNVGHDNQLCFSCHVIMAFKVVLN